MLRIQLFLCNKHFLFKVCCISTFLLWFFICCRLVTIVFTFNLLDMFFFTFLSSNIVIGKKTLFILTYSDVLLTLSLDLQSYLIFILIFFQSSLTWLFCLYFMGQNTPYTFSNLWVKYTL